MTEFGQFVLIGLVAGSVYALIAIGYTMVYGIIELINFAHADVFMIGSMMGMQLIVSAGVTADSGLFAKVAIIVLALVLCMAIYATINVVIEKIAYKPLRDAPPLAPLITAIGMSFILSNLAQKIWGPSQVSVPDLLGRIVRAFAERDAVAIRSVAHAMRGECLTLGGSHLAEICRGLETAAERGDFAEAAVRIDQACGAWMVSGPEILNYLDSLVAQQAGPPRAAC